MLANVFWVQISLQVALLCMSVQEVEEKKNISLL
jgi:hypothetical protein